jgi:LacI family transcriptional regulator
LDSYFLGINAHYVVINNLGGIYMGTKHLIEKGHRHIGYLKSATPIQNFIERYEGYLRALAEAGLHPDEKYCFSLRANMEDAYTDMKTYLENNNPLPTALIADNDLIAFGAIKALTEFNVKIPSDVSVVGFDDMPFCSMSNPPLTTIGVDKKVFGGLAVDNLIYLIENDINYYLKTVIDVALIERASTCTLG